MAGLYIHIPWCVRKCPYCDFNSHNQPAQMPEEAYLEALIDDLRRQYLRAERPRIETVFLGGGTPSLFSVASIEALMQCVANETDFSPSAEVTLEANPGTFEQAKFEGFRTAGINRLSLGVQSFSSQHLSRLGRIHGRDEALKAALAARTAGFDNLNIDLMYALPEQTLEQALEDLEQAIALAPTHLSHYQLTLEPNTLFFKHPPVLPDQDTAWDMMEACQERLNQAGFGQYEVSAYARAGYACRHNLNYWEYGDYLGIGAGAHAKITLAGGEIWRLTHPASPEAYMLSVTQNKPSYAQKVLEDERVFEFMLNSLRLKEGTCAQVFEQRTGLRFEVALAPKIIALRTEGLMDFDAQTGHFKPSARGWNYLNDLQAAFLN
jgi:oxygen-independent coproporphyrinogen-3 oxidase